MHNLRADLYSVFAPGLKSNQILQDVGVPWGDKLAAGDILFLLSGGRHAARGGALIEAGASKAHAGRDRHAARGGALIGASVSEAHARRDRHAARGGALIGAGTSEAHAGGQAEDGAGGSMDNFRIIGGDPEACPEFKLKLKSWRFVQGKLVSGMTCTGGNEYAYFNELIEAGAGAFARERKSTLS
eukprot:1159086-Pelagomonas_calceolata.AAC.9